MNKAQNGRGWNDDGTAYTVDTHATQGVAQQAIGFEPRYYTRSGTGGAPTDTPTLIASNASKFGNAAPCVAHVVAPPLTATVERSTFWNGADVAESLTCTSNDQRMPDKGRMQMVVQPAVPYDLFQITAPINRQNRDERSPCHTLARDNAAHAAVVQTLPVHDPCPTLTSRMQGSSGWAPYNEDAHLVASVTQPLAFDTYNHTVETISQRCGQACPSVASLPPSASGCKGSPMDGQPSRGRESPQASVPMVRGTVRSAIAWP